MLHVPDFLIDLVLKSIKFKLIFQLIIMYIKYKSTRKQERNYHYKNQ